jgi:hypothetical protein
MAGRMCMMNMKDVGVVVAYSVVLHENPLGVSEH